MRVWSDVCPDDAHEDGSTVECFLIVEFAAAVFEFTDGGLAQSAVLDVRKREAPLAGCGIVEKQRKIFEVTLGAFGLYFLQLSAAVPDFADDHGALHFVPGGRAG